MIGKECGIALAPDLDEKRLTNVRDVDDLLLFCKSTYELDFMLSELASILQEYGMVLNASKTKIFFTHGAPEEETRLNIGGGIFQ